MKRVEVVDEMEATGTSAQVRLGQQGTVHGNPDDSYLDVVMDGDTLPWSIPRGGLKFIDEEETMEEIKKFYKPLVETRDGRLISIWAGPRWGIRLEYREGEITYTPEGGAGIWTCESLEEAQHQGRSNGSITIDETHGVLVVHEATPLGEQMEVGVGVESAFAHDVRYPAILLGKEVWREEPREPVRPEPKFKVGDRVIISCSPMIVEFISWSLDKEAKFHNYYEAGHYHYLLSNKLTYDEGRLKLAPPEPEWVDVTKDCTFVPHGNFCGNYRILVEILHKGDRVRLLGLNQIEPEAGNGYKVEKDTETARGTQWFRVFKRNS